MLEMAEKVAAETVVRCVPGVDKTFVIGKDPSEDPSGKNPLQAGAYTRPLFSST
jgi:DNA-directed RNA polymerase I subunit RPA1